MSITVINKSELIEAMRLTLGLPVSNFPIDEPLIAACIRRTAGYLCPCSTITLVSAVLKAFQFFAGDEAEFKTQVEAILERLIVGGDLLELNDVTTSDLAVKSTWLFAAHPAFVVRPGGVILLFGITPDNISPVASLSPKIIYRGCKRYLVQNPGEDLVSLLNDLGLFNVSESAWLKLPGKTDAVAHLAVMDKMLSAAEPSGDIVNLQILNKQTKNTYYKGRWTGPAGLTGRFVAKRPYRYGTNIWCYAEIEDGLLKRFTDIPFKLNGILQRGCDGGWHLQMAIDYCSGQPQVFTIRSEAESVILHFYSPIPLWAERRLLAIGDPVEPSRCLFAYAITKEDLPEEEKFLSEILWLIRKQ